MKKILFILLFLSLQGFCSTLDEDYEQMRPLMPMLQTGGGGSVNLLKPYAEKGNSVAAYLLGVIYEEGKIVDQDENKAFEFYSLAAAKNPKAAVRKANMLISGIGTDINLNEAKVIYAGLFDDEEFGQFAKERLNQIEEIELRALYFKGLEEAAFAGDVKAQAQLAQFMLLSGNFVGAYVWFSVLSEDKELAEQQADYKAFLDKLQGKMTIHQIMQAEKELTDIKKAIKSTIIK